MAYQKLQPTQAVAVSLSDTINVISPSQPAIASGVSDKTITNNARDLSVATLSFTGNPTTITASKLTDDTADFSSVVVVTPLLISQETLLMLLQLIVPLR